MTSRIRIQNLSNSVLKVSLIETAVEGKPQSDRLVMNREPQEFDVSGDRMLVICETPTADNSDETQKVTALEAAAKEPQALHEQKNPQAVVGSLAHDPAKQPIPHATPMANTPGVAQVPAVQTGEVTSPTKASVTNDKKAP